MSAPNITLADPNRTGGPLIGQLGGVGTARDTAKVADYAVHVGEDDEFDVVLMCVEGETCLPRTADGLQVTGPCRILGYVVHVATAGGTIEVEDGITAGTGTDRFIIPASTAVGVYDFGGLGIKCTTGAYLNFVGGTGTVALIVQVAAGSVIATT